MEIRNAEDGKHKYTAIFSNPKQTIHFGDINYQDYTQHKNLLRAKSYVNRHSKNEDWNNPRTAGALSYWLLWHSPSFSNNLKTFSKRFKIPIS
jgi:hypothetical protein